MMGSEDGEALGYVKLGVWDLTSRDMNTSQGCCYH
jgi:hypothetical protein